jgi:uncharacterized RDD family membrane protein YckC
VDVDEQVVWGPDGYAGFWQRVGGSLLDSLILMAALIAVAVALAVASGAGGEDPEAVAARFAGPMNLLLLLGYFAYDTVLTARTGATIGKRAAGIEVRRPDGTLPSYGLAVGRFFARFLSSLPVMLGYLVPVFDRRKQTLHDKVVRTVVVKRAAVRSADRSPAPDAGAAPWAGADAGAAPWGGAGAGGAGAGSWGAHDGTGPAADAAPSASGGPTGDSMETATWGRPTAPAASSGTSGAAEGERPDVPEDRSAAAPAPGASGWGAPAPASSTLGGADDPVDRGASAPTADDERRDTDVDGPADVGGPVDGGSAGAGSWGSTGGESAERPPAGPAPAASDARPDPNAVAVQRAQIPPDAARWLQQVASQVDARLDRVDEGWRGSPQAEAARACAFGILLGHLARVHPHMADALGRVAEVHPSFSTLLAGSRLATLEQIAAEPSRATAWLGPLIDVDDRDRISRLIA